MSCDVCVYACMCITKSCSFAFGFWREMAPLYMLNLDEYLADQGLIVRADPHPSLLLHTCPCPLHSRSRTSGSAASLACARTNPRRSHLRFARTTPTPIPTHVPLQHAGRIPAGKGRVIRGRAHNNLPLVGHKAKRNWPGIARVDPCERISCPTGHL